MDLSRQLSNYRKRAKYEFDRLRDKLDRSRKQRKFKSWLKQFLRSDAELLLGANLDLTGGVRNHIHSISRYTMLKNQLVPLEQPLQRFSYTLFYEHAGQFLETPPPNQVRVSHSHVSPWFINWCHRNKSRLLWVHTHHLWYYEDNSPNGLLPWQKELNDAGLFALRNCHVPIAVSRSQQSFLEDQFAIKAQYVPNGVDVAACRNSNASRFRKKHGIENDFMLWMGRNEDVKNPTELIEAALCLPHFQFVMAGDSCYQNDLEKVWGNSLPSNVRAIGPLSRTEAQDAIAACSALIVTSKREGLPTLILEALVHKKRIVTSDAEGCLDAIDGDLHGLVYKRGNISQLCDKISEAQTLDLYNEKGFDFVMSTFSWNAVIRRLDAIYKGPSI